MTKHCKGCHADVTETMYCHCGEIHLSDAGVSTSDEIALVDQLAAMTAERDEARRHHNEDRVSDHETIECLHGDLAAMTAERDAIIEGLHALEEKTFAELAEWADSYTPAKYDGMTKAELIARAERAERNFIFICDCLDDANDAEEKYSPSVALGFYHGAYGESRRIRLETTPTND